MLNTQLSPCASLLYHWIRCHSQANSPFRLNLDHFQVWTSEFLQHPAKMREIKEALGQLSRLNLVDVQGTQIILHHQAVSPPIKIYPLQNFFLRCHRENQPWFWVLMLLLGFGCVSSAAIAVVYSIPSQAGHQTVIHNPFQVLGQRDSKQ